MTKIRKTEYRAFTPTELKSLVQRAQARDQQAIDRLCSAFTPLIYKEARRSYIAAALGDDAVNIAWEIFLEFIHAYKGNNYRLLPGLVQKHLYYELMHRVYPQKLTIATKSLEAAAAGGTALPTCNPLEQVVERQQLAQAIQKLTPIQQAVLNDVILSGFTLQECSQKHGLTPQTCHIHKTRALRRLQKLLSQ